MLMVDSSKWIFHYQIISLLPHFYSLCKVGPHQKRKHLNLFIVQLVYSIHFVNFLQTVASCHVGAI